VKDLGVHLLLFALISALIVTCGAFYGEPDDARALRTIPFTLRLVRQRLCAARADRIVIEHVRASELIFTARAEQSLRSGLGPRTELSIRDQSTRR
jgi:hypothetical protein